MILIIQIDYIVRVSNDKHLPVETLECNRCVLDAKSKSKIKRSNHGLISFSIEPFNFTLEDFVATLHFGKRKIRTRRFGRATILLYERMLISQIFFFFDSY